MGSIWKVTNGWDPQLAFDPCDEAPRLACMESSRVWRREIWVESNGCPAVRWGSRGISSLIPFKVLPRKPVISQGEMTPFLGVK